MVLLVILRKIRFLIRHLFFQIVDNKLKVSNSRSIMKNRKPRYFPKLLQGLILSIEEISFFVEVSQFLEKRIFDFSELIL